MIDLISEKFLVTGGGGFLGYYVIQELLRRGVPKENISASPSKEYDLRLFGVCQEVISGKSVVIHLAASTGGGDFHSNHPGKIFYDNASMGINLLEAARLGGIKKFVSIGSSMEYPKTAEVPYKEEDLWNGYPDELHAPYAMAKKLLLVQGIAYRKEYGLSVIHLLPTNMYGPGEKTDSGYFIPSLLRKIKEAKTMGRNYIEVWGSGVATREFLYVADAAEGIILAIEHYDKSDPVNLGSGEEVSIKYVTELACSLLGFSGEIRWDVSKPEGLLRRAVDISRAKKEFGFKAKTSFDLGFRNVVEWCINNS